MAEMCIREEKQDRDICMHNLYILCPRSIVIVLANFFAMKIGQDFMGILSTACLTSRDHMLGLVRRINSFKMMHCFHVQDMHS